MKYKVTISESRVYEVTADSEHEAISMAFVCKRNGWEDYVEAMGDGPTTAACEPLKEGVIGFAVPRGRK